MQDEIKINLKNKIQKVLPKDVQIIEIPSANFKQTYRFNKNEQVAEFDFFYDKKGILTNIIDKRKTPFSAELLKNFNQFKFALLRKIETIFENEILKEIILELMSAFEEENINYQLECLTNYQIRCYFEKDEERAVFDIFFKGYVMSNFREIKNLSNSQNFVEKLKEIARRKANQ